MFRTYKPSFYFLLAFLLILAKLSANDALFRLGNEAQAFMSAQEFDKAAAIYRHLLIRPLPSWQKAFVLYNLGTVKLAQNENREALDFFRSIPFESISNPHLYRMINFNQALAYLNLAQNGKQNPSVFELEERLDFYRQSLNQFEATLRLDCLLQKFEGEAELPCQTLDAVLWGVDKVKSDMSQVKTQLKETFSQVNKGDLNSPLAELRMKFSLTLLQDELSASSLEALQNDLQELDSNDQEALKEASDYVSKSIELFSRDQKDASEFYLIAAFEKLKKTEAGDPGSPQEALSLALMQAWQVKKMMHLLANLSGENRTEQSILEKLQQGVVEAGKLFFKYSLSFQTNSFRQKDDQTRRCQEKPWNRVFPLYSQGSEAALSALSAIEHPQEAVREQERTIDNWKEALKILSEPIPPDASNGSTSEEKKIEQFNELFRSIREMQAQDVPKEKTSDRELHSW